MPEREVSFDTNDPFVRPLVEGATRVTLELFDEHPAAAELGHVVSQVHDFAGEMARTLTERVEEVRRLPLACEEGCSFCCRGTPVLASAPEVLALAAHLRSTRTETELAALIARVADTHARVADLDIDERAASKIPCPLLDLERGACTAYEARPIACRAYNSCDKGRCEAAYDSGLANPVLPVNPILFQATHATGFGLMVGSELRGREVGPYELVGALHAALGDPTLVTAWSEGREVFSHGVLSGEGASAYREKIGALASAFRGGLMRDTEKVAARLDPDARRRERNKRKKATGKKK